MDMDLQAATTTKLVSPKQKAVEHVHADHIGAADTHSLEEIYTKIKEAYDNIFKGSTQIHLGRTKIKIQKVKYEKLTSALKKKILEATTPTGTSTKNVIPGLKQFVGLLEDQYLYFLETPDNIFLSHLGEILSYETK